MQELLAASDALLKSINRLFEVNGPDRYEVARIYHCVAQARRFLEAHSSAWESWCAGTSAIPRLGFRLASLRTAFGLLIPHGLPAGERFDDAPSEIEFVRSFDKRTADAFAAAVARLEGTLEDSEVATSPDHASAIRRLLVLTINHRDEIDRALREDAACAKTKLLLAEWRTGIRNGRPFGNTPRVLALFQRRYGNGPWDRLYLEAVAEVARSPAAAFYLPKLESLRNAYLAFRRGAHRAFERGTPSAFQISEAFKMAAAINDCGIHIGAAAVDLSVPVSPWHDLLKGVRGGLSRNELTIMEMLIDADGALALRVIERRMGWTGGEWKSAGTRLRVKLATFGFTVEEKGGVIRLRKEVSEMTPNRYRQRA